MKKSTQVSTENYIRKHRNNVASRINKIIKELFRRAEEHDKSKLQEPELSGWKEMDKEPRYPYGTPEYFDKMRRYQWVFDAHYKANRHHPEHWQGFFIEMDLLDFLEMILDWVSYKEDITINEMYKIVSENCERFEFPPLMRELAINTLKRYIVREDDIFDEMGVPHPDIDTIDWSKWE